MAFLSSGGVGGFVDTELSKKTSVFGLRLWVLLGVCVGAAIVLVLFLLSLCLSSRRRSSPALPSSASPPPAAARIKKPPTPHLPAPPPPPPTPLPATPPHPPPTPLAPAVDVRVDLGKANRRAALADHFRPPPAPPSASTTGTASGETAGTPSSAGGGGPPEVSPLGWGRWYTLRELEEATGGLAEENVIGEGGYGIVYLGKLADNNLVAIKNMLNSRCTTPPFFLISIFACSSQRIFSFSLFLFAHFISCLRFLLFKVFVDTNERNAVDSFDIRGQAEKEFKVEVEAIGRVRHKNLVRLLGYCVEGAYRYTTYS
ncbi:hypothetical protein GW17_00018712 [Ensete ventricosum]|nr:hypothetical protein GW17_00018712 [Ensete ventricosum]